MTKNTEISPVLVFIFEQPYYLLLTFLSILSFCRLLASPTPSLVFGKIEIQPTHMLATCHIRNI